jgi:adenosylmethionine-8-amino-7-oxononanoate aminotransferase
LQRNTERAAAISAALAPLAGHPQVRHFRRQGMIWAFDAVVNDADAARTFSRRFFSAALQNELLLRPIGRTVYLMPPYVLDDGDIAHMAAATLRSFEQTMAEA